METSSYHLILFTALLTLLGLNLFFSLCETSFSSLSRIKLKNMTAMGKHSTKAEKRKAKRAHLVLKMTENYDKLLSSILIGNTIVNITASALAAVLFYNLLGAKGVSFATAVLTLVVLLFCEISPKTLAKDSPETTALRVAPFMRLFIVIFTPLNYLTGVWKKVIVKVFPVKHNRSHTEDELLTFVEEVRKEGGINVREEQMIRQVIDFDELKVSGIYTPRVDVEAVSAVSTLEEIDRKFIETGFSRLPVFKDSIDNILGIIILKDFYHEVMKGLKTPEQIVKPVVFVPKTIKVAQLLKTMQGKKAHMAVVVDEHGGALGIVTIEDIVEELVGDIWDEHDEVVEPVKKNHDGSFTVIAGVYFKEMLETINSHNESQPDLSVQNQGNQNFPPDTTVANWFMENIGRLPHVGETLVWNHLTIKVSRVSKQRIIEVRVTAANISGVTV